MRHSPTPPSSWTGYKELGKGHFERGDYETSLTAYCAAINPELNCPASERQIVLSNMVACRLKIGGPAHARAAVENAKQCIAINDRWAKGYVRLAAAYIALGGHSNDACNTLQRALQLDPTNPTARQMLVRELRREQHGAAASASASAPPQDQDDEGVGDSTQIPVDQDQIDDSISFQDRIKFYYTRAYMWYHGQSEDFRTILKVFVVLLLLYVAFGGRFGLEYTSQKVNRGNYEVGNAYDRYYSRDSGKPAGADKTDYNPNPRQQQNTHDTSQRRTGTNGGSSSFHFPNLLDGSAQSMVIMMGIVYVGHRNGINPMQAIMVMNMMGGRGRPRGMGGFGRGMGGFGGGMGGFGGGMRHGMGRPGRRNGWF